MRKIYQRKRSRKFVPKFCLFFINYFQMFQDLSSIQLVEQVLDQSYNDCYYLQNLQIENLRVILDAAQICALEEKDQDQKQVFKGLAKIVKEKIKVKKEILRYKKQDANEGKNNDSQLFSQKELPNQLFLQKEQGNQHSSGKEPSQMDNKNMNHKTSKNDMTQLIKKKQKKNKDRENYQKIAQEFIHKNFISVALIGFSVFIIASNYMKA